MQLETGWSEFDAQGARLRGYFARPARADEPLPIALVIQEAWGVDEHIRDVADRVAGAGYLAFSPDLYSRDTSPEMAPERVEAAKGFLDTLPPGTWGDEQARAQALSAHPQGAEIGATFRVLFGGAGREHHVPDLQAALNHARERADTTQEAVSVGFCMGGGLSGQLAASDAALEAAVCFYGTPPAAEQAQRISCPMLGIYGGEDARITDQVPAFADAMSAAGRPFEHHTYPGAPHAFFNDTRPSYRAGASRDAWARTLSFFARHL